MPITDSRTRDKAPVATDKQPTTMLSKLQSKSGDSQPHPNPNMPSTDSRKRKEGPTPEDKQSKKPRTSEPDTKSTLITPHQSIITALTSGHTILPLSIISSTQIQARVTSATRHLLKHPERGLILLYARPPEVCKLITVVEQCKRLLRGEGKGWWQGNEMFEMEREDKERKRKKRDEDEIVEKTVLEGVGVDDEDDEDNFEVMESRFEKAVLPPQKPTIVQSLRVFLALDAVQGLKTRKGITVQMSEAKPA